jgi:hypothetical protein
MALTKVFKFLNYPLGIVTRVKFNLRGGLAFQNKRTHQTVVGTLFSKVLDRAEQVGVRRKKSSNFF